MTFISLRGNRESLTKKSEDFKGKIIKYMISRNYILSNNSYFDGLLPDLIFNRPFIEGEKETWVESKDTDLSITNKDFLNEFGRIFNTYMEREESRKFNLFLFIRKVKNKTVWLNIFEETKGYKDDIKKIYELTKDALTDKDLQQFNSHSFTDFVYFIHSVSLVEGDYLDLVRESESIQKRDQFNLDKNLLDDKSQVLFHKELLVGNCRRITSFPEILWVGEISKKIDSDFWRNKDSIAYPYKNLVFSVKPIQNSKISEYVKQDTVQKISFDKMPVQDINQKKNIIKSLIRNFIIYKGRKIGLIYFDENHCLFFHHKNLQGQLERNYKNRQASKYFSKGGFVRHEALRIDVKEYDGSFYAIFDMAILFTTNGYEIITGERASSLYKKFPKVHIHNDGEKSKLYDWVQFLNFNITSLDNTEKEYFSLAPFEQIECGVTYEGGEDFNVTLLDFMNEEKDEKEELCPSQ